jgi:2-polyprenyl-3-methyl-5-hydroxy-6-metoxy-1,4-benzoquinol methylase
MNNDPTSATVKVDYYKSQDGRSNLESYKGLVSHALPGLHSFVIKTIEDMGYISSQTRKRALDLGAGQGAMSARLVDKNCSVLACDYVDENFAAGTFGVEFRRLDLNQDFAEVLGENSADIISAIEIVEHIENPRHFIRECTRLLRSDGLLILTTPNIDSARSKVDFLVDGTFHMFRDSSYKSSGHITPICAWQLIKMIEETQLDVVHHCTYGSEEYSLRDRPKAFLVQSFIRRFGHKYPWGNGAIHIMLLGKK